MSPNDGNSDYQFDFNDDMAGNDGTSPVGDSWNRGASQNPISGSGGASQNPISGTSNRSQNPIGGTGRATDPFGNPINQATYQAYAYTGTPILVNQPPKTRWGCIVWFIILMSCGLPLLIIALVTVPMMGSLSGEGGFLEGISELISQVTEGLSPPYSEAVAGDAANFNPLTGLAQAQRIAGDGAQFTEFNFTNVRSDGTMDLTDRNQNAYAEYSFLRPIPEPADAPPVGSAGNSGGQWYQPITVRAYEPGQFRSRRTTSNGISTSIQYTNQGMELNLGDPTTRPSESVSPLPVCDLALMWAEAISDFDAPANGVATIRYEGGEYQFSMSTGINIRFTDGCKVVGR